MTLQELEAELKVKWNELLAHFHALFHKAAPAPVVEAPAPQSPPVEAPPQAPVAPAATNVANTGTDNWLTREMSAQAGPQVETKPSNDPGNPWLEYQSGTLVVPAEWGYAGNGVKALGNCEIHFKCSDIKPRDVIVNQGSIPQSPSVTVETSAGTVTKDLGAPSAQHCGVVTPVNGEIVVKVTQVGGCVVMLGMV